MSPALSPPPELLRAPAAGAYITVINDDGQPVRGLGAEDFAMRDGAVRQAVLGAEPATEPIAAVILPLARADVDAARTHAAARTFSDALTRANAAHVARELKASPMSPEEMATAITVACAALANAPTDRRVV